MSRGGLCQSKSSRAGWPIPGYQTTLAERFDRLGKPP